MKSAGLGKEEGDFEGPVDVLILAPSAGAASPPWSLYFQKKQLSSTSFQVVKKFLKSFRPIGYTSGWAFTFVTDRWMSIDNHGVPNSLKLGEFLQHEDTVAMFKDVSSPMCIGLLMHRPAFAYASRPSVCPR